MLTQIQDSLWTVASPLTVLGCIQLNTRMTIIRLQSGKLFLHSPVPWSVELQQAVEQIGEVGFIVAPSCFHHMFVGGWHENNPNAQICAPKGLIKREKICKLNRFFNQMWIYGRKFKSFRSKGCPLSKNIFSFINQVKPLSSPTCSFTCPIPPDSHPFMPGSTGSKVQSTHRFCLRRPLKIKRRF